MGIKEKLKSFVRKFGISKAKAKVKPLPSAFNVTNTTLNIPSAISYSTYTPPLTATHGYTSSPATCGTFNPASNSEDIEDLEADIEDYNISEASLMKQLDDMFLNRQISGTIQLYFKMCGVPILKLVYLNSVNYKQKISEIISDEYFMGWAERKPETYDITLQANDWPR